MRLLSALWSFVRTVWPWHLVSKLEVHHRPECRSKGDHAAHQ